MWRRVGPTAALGPVAPTVPPGLTGGTFSRPRTVTLGGVLPRPAPGVRPGHPTLVKSHPRASVAHGGTGRCARAHRNTR